MCVDVVGYTHGIPQLEVVNACKHNCLGIICSRGAVQMQRGKWKQPRQMTLSIERLRTSLSPSTGPRDNTSSPASNQAKAEAATQVLAGHARQPTAPAMCMQEQHKLLLGTLSLLLCVLVACIPL
jgi:hypothetical protein